MKSIPTLIGTAKCAFVLVLVLLATAVGGKTDPLKQAAAQAKVTLPALTGPHKTGRMSFHWMDDERAELETIAPDDKRELMVHLFYPADAKASGARASCVPDADAMHGPWNDGQVARITAMRAFSIENAALPRGKARYPVVIFMPGGGINIDGTQGEYSFQPVKGADVSGSQPLLWIQKTLPAPPTDEQLQRARRTRAPGCEPSSTARCAANGRISSGSRASPASHSQRRQCRCSGRCGHK